MTRTSLSIFVLALTLAACGDPSGTSATNPTDSTSTTVEPTSTTVEPTSTTVEPTTTPPTGTTADSDAGSESESESGPGTSTSTSDSTTLEPSTSTNDTSTSTSDSTTTLDPSTSTGETDGVVPGLFGECKTGMCPDSDSLCVTQDGPGGFGPNTFFQVTWSFCTRECETDDDCASGLAGGTAPVRCVEQGPNMVKVCVLDCGFGQTCPDSLTCSNGQNCGTQACECEGELCGDPLCTG